MKNTTKTVIARADATIAAYRATMAKATPPAPKPAAPVDKQAQAQASYAAFVGKHFAKYAFMSKLLPNLNLAFDGKHYANHVSKGASNV